ncbi:SAM-dependent methyltransferase [Azorhizobium doebereinerae]|uniref:SAM-dependent methyltransferase n=1 Tax=Azorhizobium doebereinerae TaxID=281091 RepID=UPI000687AF9F|nr:SAM-dependent methyltransferase [Azorhizobium doebereinerae]
MSYDEIHRELSKADPWGLDGSDFEQRRLFHLARLCREGPPIKNALEIGCAGGAFTEKLAMFCSNLTVIDVMKDAIDRSKKRVSTPNIEWILSDVRSVSSSTIFDVIVCSEVLYYLESEDEIHSVICNLANMLAADGRLVIGSARDELCKIWGRAAGAETIISIARSFLNLTQQISLKGEKVQEDCVIAVFQPQKRQI